MSGELQSCGLHHESLPGRAGGGAGAEQSLHGDPRAPLLGEGQVHCPRVGISLPIRKFFRKAGAGYLIP